MVASPMKTATSLALDGDLFAARQQLEALLHDSSLESSLIPRLQNNLATVDAALGHVDQAVALLESIPASQRSAAVQQNLSRLQTSKNTGNHQRRLSSTRVRVAIVSFLFNWPSTGGGIVHTVELTKFLRQAGYEVQLIHPVLPEWGIGQVDHTCPVDTIPLRFSIQDWTIPRIQQRFREAVDEFDPDHIIITDCWNFKPYIAQAMEGYSYLLRMQASECLCPFNNLRLRPDRSGGVQQCSRSQPATPRECMTCLVENDRFSGSLHRAERQLSQVGTDRYHSLLRQTVRSATAVLVLNSSTQALWELWSDNVRVVTWGMDAERFPEPEFSGPSHTKLRLLFAGLPQEPIKGFSVLQAACRQLWQMRQDFELRVTADANQFSSSEPFLKCIGWQSQEQLPQRYREADLVVVPTIAQEGLSRTAVEGMACGKPVLGSRIGGMPEVMTDGLTGLLAEPGDVADWGQKLNWFLDHPEERLEMGRQGRKRFERSFTWERVIEEQYAPLLTPATTRNEATMMC
ncbi:MAG TPA: glycosyltransferase [Planctomicrobium sp.]|nr:glycosyltransferase [Planctomicrobium sp.]